MMPTRIFASCLWLLNGAIPASADERVDTFKELSRSVFKLEGTRVESRGPSQGSAVFLGEETKGDRTVGYFATCYHVLANCQSIRLDSSDGELSIKTADGNGIEFFASRARDIVILRTRLMKEHNLRPALCGENPVGRLREMRPGNFYMNSALEGLGARPVGGDNKQGDPGVAIGFPHLERTISLPIDVDIWGLRLARTLGLTESDEKTEAANLQIGYLGNEITLPAMSGGLVATVAPAKMPGQFAGLVFGRLLDEQGLMIQAVEVLDALREALSGKDKSGKDKFIKFIDGMNPEQLSLEPPFKEQVNVSLQSGTDTVLLSKLTWDSISRWSVAFEADEAQAKLFKRFQEIVVPLSYLAPHRRLDEEDRNDRRDQEPRVAELIFLSDNEDEALKGEPFKGCPAKKGFEVKFNGKSNLQLGEGGEAVSLKLHPGENLLVVSRNETDQTTRGGSVSLNDFLNKRRPIHVAIKRPGGESYRILRSLPAVIDRYSIYLTIIDDETKLRANPPDHDVTIDVDMGMLRQAVAEMDPQVFENGRNRAASFIRWEADFDGVVRADLSVPAWGPEGAPSPRTLDLSIPITARILEGVIREYGLTLGLPLIERELNILARVQILPAGTGGGLSVRVLAATCSEPIEVVLGQIRGGEGKGEGPGLALDIRGAASQALVSQLNKATPFGPGGSDLFSQRFAELFSDAPTMLGSLVGFEHLEDEDRLRLFVAFNQKEPGVGFGPLSTRGLTLEWTGYRREEHEGEHLIFEGTIHAESATYANLKGTLNVKEFHAKFMVDLSPSKEVLLHLDDMRGRVIAKDDSDCLKTHTIILKFLPQEDGKYSVESDPKLSDLILYELEIVPDGFFDNRP